MEIRNKPDEHRAWVWGLAKVKLMRRWSRKWAAPLDIRKARRRVRIYSRQPGFAIIAGGPHPVEEAPQGT